MTGTALLISALRACGYFLKAGMSPSASELEEARLVLNDIVSTWTTQALTFPFISREVFNVTAGVSTYTIGPSGTFNTTRPWQLTGSALLLNSSTPPVEIPTAVLTDDMYQAIAIKTQTNTLWTEVYYNPTYAAGLGAIFLWPTPTTNVNQLVLYFGTAVAAFADVTTDYTIPPGYGEALKYELAARLLSPYRVMDPQIRRDVEWRAHETLSSLKAANADQADLSLDPAYTQRTHGTYVIQTDQGA